MWYFLSCISLHILPGDPFTPLEIFLLSLHYNQSDLSPGADQGFHCRDFLASDQSLLLLTESMPLTLLGWHRDSWQCLEQVIQISDSHTPAVMLRLPSLIYSRAIGDEADAQMSSAGSRELVVPLWLRSLRKAGVNFFSQWIIQSGEPFWPHFLYASPSRKLKLKSFVMA